MGNGAGFEYDGAEKRKVNYDCYIKKNTIRETSNEKKNAFGLKNTLNAILVSS